MRSPPRLGNPLSASPGVRKCDRYSQWLIESVPNQEVVSIQMLCKREGILGALCKILAIEYRHVDMAPLIDRLIPGEVGLELET